MALWSIRRVFEKWSSSDLNGYIDGLVQDHSIPIANPLEILQSRTKPSKILCRNIQCYTIAKASLTLLGCIIFVIFCLRDQNWLRGGGRCHNARGRVRTGCPIPRPLGRDIGLLSPQAWGHHNHRPRQTDRNHDYSVTFFNFNTWVILFGIQNVNTVLITSTVWHDTPIFMSLNDGILTIPAIKGCGTCDTLPETPTVWVFKYGGKNNANIIKPVYNESANFIDRQRARFVTHEITWRRKYIA